MENHDNSTKEQLLKEIDQLKAEIGKLQRCESKRNLVEEQLDAIYQNAPTMMILVDEERRVRKVNGATVDFADVLEEEMLGLRGGEALRCLHHTDDPKGCGYGPACDECMVKQTVLETFRTGDSFNHIEAKLPFLIDDKKQDLTLQVSTVLLKNTEEPLVLVTIEDITKQKQSEQAIQESNSLLTSIIESPDNVIMFALDLNYNYLGFNKAHIKEMKFIYDTDIEIGKHIIDYIPNEEDRAKVLINYKRVTKGERFIEIQEYGDADNRFWYELIFNPIYDDLKNVTGFTVFVTNITARKQTEIALKESSDLLKNLTSQVPGTIYQFLLRSDGTSCFPYSSMGIKDIYGVTPEQVKTSADLVFAVLHPDDLESVSEKIQQSANELSPWRDEYRVILPGKKEPSWREGYAIPERLEDGSTLWHGFITNIDQRKQVEKALKKSEERFASFIESAIDGIVIYDSNINLIEINKAALEIFPEGTHKENLIGKNILDIVPSLKESGRYDKYLNVIKTGESIILNDVIPDSKFGARYLTLKAFKVGNGLGIIFTDITERKQANTALTIQKQKLADILEGTNAGTWNWNIVTGELTIDKRWAEIIGYTLNELEPIDVKTWINNVHPDDLPEANTLLNKLFNKEIDYYDVEFRQPHKNGSWIWVNARGKVIEWTEDGKPVRMSGTHLDITGRKHAQEELSKHREQLEELVKERTLDLETKNKELDNAMKVFVGREMTIKDLQRRIRALEGK